MQLFKNRLHIRLVPFLITRKPENDRPRLLPAYIITTIKRTNLSHRHLLFTADSQLITPHVARGATVALISGNRASCTSRYVSGADPPIGGTGGRLPLRAWLCVLRKL